MSAKCEKINKCWSENGSFQTCFGWLIFIHKNFIIFCILQLPYLFRLKCYNGHCDCIRDKQLENYEMKPDSETQSSVRQKFHWLKGMA